MTALKLDSPPEDLSLLPRSPLQRLAESFGIQPYWRDIAGAVHQASDKTLVSLLKAMNVPQDETPPMLARRLNDVERLLPPVLVCPEGTTTLTIPLHLLAFELDRPLAWTLTLEDKTSVAGTVTPLELPLHTTHQSDDKDIEERHWRFSHPLPCGYHHLSVSSFDEGGTSRVAAVEIIITPSRCYQPEPMANNHRLWGPAIQLYAIRSERNWGIGDFTDLKTLIALAGEKGASLVGLNPLHALYPTNPNHTSPYSPSSRLFWNTLYLDVEAIEDFIESPEAQSLVASAIFQENLKQLREAPLVDYPGVMEAKWPVLELLYRCFCSNHLKLDTLRAQHYRDFVAAGGQNLRRFALYQALQEQYHREDSHTYGWCDWPEMAHDPDATVVERFAESHSDRIGFYLYLQWQTTLQLQAAAHACQQQGMELGLYTDLAVGVDRGSADVWGNRVLYAHHPTGSASVGAPTDALNPIGQNWGLPPMIPHVLRNQAYEPWITLLRQAMSASGAIRIDHVMGLMRLFWIPANASADDGTYVYYPFEAMMGILALESQRNHCVVVGEDLGIVPNEMREAMARYGVLGIKVGYFERHWDWENQPYRAPQDYPADAAVSLSNHDLPTLSGFWSGYDIAVKQDLGWYDTPEALQNAIDERESTRQALMWALNHQGLWNETTVPDPINDALVQQLYRYFARSAGKLMLIQLEDVLGQREQVNLPGTTTEHYNWCRKLPLTLEAMADDGRWHTLTQTLSEERPR